MEGILPREIIYRKKCFGAPIRRWLKCELKELVKEVLSKQSINKRGIFSYERVQKLIEDNDKNKCDGSYAILSLISIEIWCRRFIDQRTFENLIKVNNETDNLFSSQKELLILKKSQF